MENINTVENEIVDVAAEAAPEVIEEACAAAKSGSAAAKYIVAGAGAALFVEAVLWAGKKYALPWLDKKRKSHKAKKTMKKAAKKVNNIVEQVIDAE